MMTKRDLLSEQPLRDLAKRFDAEHVEHNDDLSPEKGVSDQGSGSNDAKKVSTTPLNVPNVIKWQYMDGSECVQEFTQDSREKLEADVQKWCGGRYAYQADMVYAWLKRQAAITERELHGKIRTLQKQNEEHLRLIDGLTAERDEWKTKCETREVAYKQADAERKRYSEQIDELIVERDELAEKADESGELVNGGNAEDWYRCLEDMTRGKELIEKSLTAENKRLRAELESARAGLKHQKAMRKKAESLVKDGQALDMAELKAERDMWRERCGRMLDAAHELARIAEVDA